MITVAFMTLGCKVNQYETEAMIELFLSSGYGIVDYEQTADVYVINTCTVTNFGDKKSRQAIRKAKKNNPNSIIIVVGCYSQVASEEIEKIDGVNIILGTKDRIKIVEILEGYQKEKGILNKVENITKNHEFEKLHLDNMQNRTRAYLKIQDGCNQFCTYCIIPYARGPIRSRLPEDIVLEVNNLVSKGFKEVVLTGIHVASYGKDLNDINLIKIITMINQIDGLERIRFSSIEPNIITDEFLDSLAKLNKVCNHIHLSLQSGCDDILKKMNRHYTTEQYYQSVLKLKQCIKDIAITTDVIVGFPGESEINFYDTCEFVKTIGFSKIHIFPYSAKKGTKAATMQNQIDSLTKNNRVKELSKIEEQMRFNFLNSHKFKTVKVLFETEIEKNIFEGYTTNYIKVKSNSQYDIKNKIYDVNINEIKNEYAKGEILFA